MPALWCCGGEVTKQEGNGCFPREVLDCTWTGQLQLKKNCSVTPQLGRNTISTLDTRAQMDFEVGEISTRAASWEVQHLLARCLGNILLSLNLQRLLSSTFSTATASSLLDTQHDDSTQALAVLPRCAEAQCSDAISFTPTLTPQSKQTKTPADEIKPAFSPGQKSLQSCHKTAPSPTTARKLSRVAS